MFNTIFKFELQLNIHVQNKESSRNRNLYKIILKKKEVK